MDFLPPLLAERHLQIEHLRVECQQRRHIRHQFDGKPVRLRIVAVNQDELSHRPVEIERQVTSSWPLLPGAMVFASMLAEQNRLASMAPISKGREPALDTVKTRRTDSSCTTGPIS